ncbi:MAG: S-adenosylmethionine:tRNA ribosyltransferase-isomerase [Bacteroidales bacterium]|nr:S-adenosylmethionine:tRNA ribosyltransferase-isomerase [Bacteroidales bacterium]
MKKPDYIHINEYNYDLPDCRIAKYPLRQRDRSKLLVYNGGSIASKYFYEIPDIFSDTDLLIFNKTRVVQARLIFTKDSGSRIEVFCLEPVRPSDFQLAYSSGGPVDVLCLIGNARKWKSGRLKHEHALFNLTAELIGRTDDKFIVRFNWDDPSMSFAEILHHSGQTPIPPYLKRTAIKRDETTYQTVYAEDDGSVAAPTAGLHFTNNVLQELRSKGIGMNSLVLHVGAGTFIPVKEENATDHSMHAELVGVDRSMLESLISDQRIIAVGTTSTRSLESLYWLGVKAASGNDFSFENLNLDQWESYGMYSGMKRKDAIASLIGAMDRAGINSFSFRTRIMIVPGYSCKIINGLITNFHQPKSTLLLLIAALTGNDWKMIYTYAIDNDFRFLSYGDSSLILL